MVKSSALSPSSMSLSSEVTSNETLDCPLKKGSLIIPSTAPGLNWKFSTFDEVTWIESSPFSVACLFNVTVIVVVSVFSENDNSLFSNWAEPCCTTAWGSSSQLEANNTVTSAVKGKIILVIKYLWVKEISHLIGGVGRNRCRRLSVGWIPRRWINNQNHSQLKTSLLLKSFYGDSWFLVAKKNWLKSRNFEIGESNIENEDFFKKIFEIQRTHRTVAVIFSQNRLDVRRYPLSINR